jgi:hypothetical protein
MPKIDTNFNLMDAQSQDPDIYTDAADSPVSGAGVVKTNCFLAMTMICRQSELLRLP